MSFKSQNIPRLGMAGADNLRYWAGGRWRQCRPAPDGACRVPPDFCGICVASAPDPTSDDYVLARLEELGLTQVRLDYTYASRAAHGERFLKRLLDASFRVCLHLVQPPAEVSSLAKVESQERWRTFLAETLEAYAARVEMIEIGSTCNRRRWSGYTPAAFLISWQIAWEEAQRFKVRLAAPNVTDFEPFYNVAILSVLRRGGMLPALHSDNLFVERATEPEAFDHKILGRRLAGLIRCNLVRKARILRDIGLWAGVPETFCAHVTWSLRRIARQLDQVEAKQADYAARYLCLAAASGALRRVYWGPLIGQREGLIDDGTCDYPEIPHVAFYGHIRGHSAAYRRRPAFDALRTANRFLAGAEFRGKVPTGPGLEILEFARQPPPGAEPPSTPGNPPAAIFHVAWTTNGNAAEAAACYAPGILQTAAAYSRDGRKLDRIPPLFTESPVYLVWPAPVGDQPAISHQQSPRSPMPGLIAGVRFAASDANEYAPFRRGAWTGFVLAREAGQPFDSAPLLDLALPQAGDNFASLPHAAVVLRDSRNRVWSVPAPGDRARRLVIKQFMPRGVWRRLLAWQQPDRAQRSWNGAQELLRRGIPTPQPIAFLHAAERPRRQTCFYICRAFENGWSARDAFTAFSRGATRFQGKTDREIYAAVARCLQTLHARGVFHRDLSAGNLLFRCAPESEIEFALIDTARARFYPAAAAWRQRFCDLVRLCHPLHWPGRASLADTYLRLAGRRFHWWMKIPFAYYDAKHRIKNAGKRWWRAVMPRWR